MLSLNYKKIIIYSLFLYAFLEFFPWNESLNNLVLGMISIALVISLTMFRTEIRTDSTTLEIYIFMLLWFIWGLLGVLWADDSKFVIVDTLLILKYIVIFVIFSHLFRNKSRREQFIIFLQMLFIFYIGFCIWEMVTMVHLPSSRLYDIKIPIPTGAYYNENNFASFMLLIVPFLMVPSVLNRRSWQKVGFDILMMLMLVIVIIQSSRFVTMIYGLYLILYFVFKAKWVSRLLFIILLLGGLSYFSHTYPKEWRIARFYVEDQINSTTTESSSINKSSFQIRKAILLEGLDIAWNSYLLGVGAGNFEIEMQKERRLKTNWITNTHNYWLELLANFGIIIFLGYLLIYIRWFIGIIQMIRSKDCTLDQRKLYYAVLISMVFFIPLTIIPSSIRVFFSIWIYLAYIHSICYSEDLCLTNHYKIKEIEAKNEQLTEPTS